MMTSDNCISVNVFSASETYFSSPATDGDRHAMHVNCYWHGHDVAHWRAESRRRISLTGLSYWPLHEQADVMSNDAIAANDDPVAKVDEPKIRMAEPLRFRLDRRMRAAVVDHAKGLSVDAGQSLGISAALRDLVARALDMGAPDTAYASGFREGFLAGWAAIKREAARQALTGLAMSTAGFEPESGCGAIGPLQPDGK
jgi:hypothetical protein